jgi:hypothetical protein
MDTRLHLFTHRRLRYSPTDRLRIVKKQMTGGSGMDAVFEAGRPGPRPSRSTAFARAAQPRWAATSRARCRRQQRLDQIPLRFVQQLESPLAHTRNSPNHPPHTEVHNLRPNLFMKHAREWCLRSSRHIICEDFGALPDGTCNRKSEIQRLYTSFRMTTGFWAAHGTS